MMVSAMGDESVEVSRNGALAKLFGVTTAREEDYYRIVMDTSEMTKDLRADAKRWYDSMRALNARDLNQNDYDQEVWMRSQVWQIIKDQQERRIFLDEFDRLQEFDRKAGRGTIGMDMAKKIMLGGEMGEQVKNMITGSPAISAEAEAQLLDLHEVLTEARE